MVMASALCADRAVAAAPAHRPVASAALRLASKLFVLLRRGLLAVRIAALRRIGRAVRPARLRLESLAQCFAPPSLSPFQFRLPPPLA